MTTAERPFFMPDGNGGTLPPDKAEETYEVVRQQAASESFWGGTFTTRRVYEVVSEHNGRRYINRVGDLTSDRKFILGIFESRDEHGEVRFVVQSLLSTIHVDASKVISVRYFSGS